MWDDILEIVLELIFEGEILVAASKKVPIPLLVLCAVFILILILGVCGLLIYVGFCAGNIVLSALGIVLFVIFAVWIVSKVREHKK